MLRRFLARHAPPARDRRSRRWRHCRASPVVSRRQVVTASAADAQFAAVTDKLAHALVHRRRSLRSCRRSVCPISACRSGTLEPSPLGTPQVNATYIVDPAADRCRRDRRAKVMVAGYRVQQYIHTAGRGARSRSPERCSDPDDLTLARVLFERPSARRLRRARRAEDSCRNDARTADLRRADRGRTSWSRAGAGAILIIRDGPVASDG